MTRDRPGLTRGLRDSIAIYLAGVTVGFGLGYLAARLL